MNMRKITSMTMFISLIVLTLNSIVLYVVPEGRVAYWADWRFWGLTKGQWGDQHITVGVLFLVAGLLHIYLNWKPIVVYMKNKAREIKIFTGAFNVALALTAIFVVGTIYKVPPMSSILHFSASFKDSGSIKYGEPPYGHAELSSLKMFTKKENIDLEESLELLDAAGLTVVDETEIIKNIAKNNNMTPQQVYEVIRPASREKEVATSSDTTVSSFPDAPKSGWGNKTIASLSTEYSLKLERILHKLADRGINAKAESKIKDIAAENSLDPMGLFEIMQEIAKVSGH